MKEKATALHNAQKLHAACAAFAQPIYCAIWESSAYAPLAQPPDGADSCHRGKDDERVFSTGKMFESLCANIT
jgi:hypothetical protein